MAKRHGSVFFMVVCIAAGPNDASAEGERPIGVEGRQSAIHCNANLPTLPELAPIAKKLVLTSDGRPTLEMQADSSKPDALERGAVSKWMERRNECFEQVAGLMAAEGAPRWLTSATMRFKDSADALIAALYRGDLTYGDYNFKFAALQADLRRRLDEGATLGRREGVASNAADALPPEVQKRDLVADTHSCKTEAARTYPVQIVRRMVDPGFQAPQSRSSTTTRCNSVGNQVICESSPNVGLDASIYNRPPQYADDDVNAGRRIAAFESCMTAKGYKRR